MTTILISAYAVNPFKGSEDGSGWNFIVQAARFYNIIAVTRKNNRVNIENYISQHPEQNHLKNITFLYFDLPYWMRFWKKKNRGALLYFYLWQRAMPLYIRKKNLYFEAVHNLNFHNDWTPTFLYKLKKPLIWGPMEHHPPIPKQFIKPVYGNRAWFKDLLSTFVKHVMRKYNPAMRRALKQTELAIAGHKGVVQRFPVPPKNIFIMSLVGAEKQSVKPKKLNGEFIVLSVGRFVPLKGFDVTIRAFATFYHKLSKQQRQQVKLVLVGAGKFKKVIAKLIEENGIEDNTEVIRWIPKHQLDKVYRKAHLFLFPSHEGAGMVVVEALSYGLPVICFDNHGPGELVDDTCAYRIPYGSYNKTIEQFASSIEALYRHPEQYGKMSQSALKLFDEKYLWDSKGDDLHMLYKKVLSNQFNNLI